MMCVRAASGLRWRNVATVLLWSAFALASCAGSRSPEPPPVPEEAVAAEPDPRFRVGAMGRAYFAETDPKVLCAELWIQALTEASDDAEIRKFLRKQMREVHDFVTDVIRRSQAEGGILDDRDASAEAWIFISIGLLGTVSRRVGNLLEDDFEAIIASRRKWMTGT